MNDTLYQRELDSITKSLEKAIEMNWITKNEHIRLEAISHHILGDLHSFRRELEKEEKISEAFHSLDKYMPEVFEKVLEALKESEEKASDPVSEEKKE